MINKKDGIVKHFGKIVKQRPQMNRSTKNVPIDKKKVGIIAIAIIVIISSIIGIQSAFQDRINWNDIVLGNIIPEPASNRGYIGENSKRKLDMDVYNITATEYYAYISACSEKEFIIDPEAGEFAYSAYNKEGYKLEVTYSDYSEEMSIDLEEPMQLGSIDWNFDGLGQYIPELDSNVGVILNDDEKEFSLYVGNIDRIEFENYVKKCNEEGFNVSSTTTDESYEAKNKDGYKIRVEYVGFNIIEITIFEPVYAVSIRVECVENLVLNKYDVDASIEGQKSLGTITHGSTENFQVELPKGTYTLYCKNDCLDEDYEDTEAEGETKFEVTGEMNIAFEIYCRTDSINVTVISDDEESQEETEEKRQVNKTEEKRQVNKDEVMMPNSAIMYKGDKYQDVKKQMKSLGFNNIKTKAVYDLGTGWLGRASIDDVKTISISGNSEFHEGDVFKKNSLIVITYRKYEIDDPAIKFKKYTVTEMVNDLDKNAARAKEKYDLKYVEITGRVTMIDDTSSNFKLIPTNNDWEFRTVDCMAKTDAHEQKIKNISNGDIITVRGKIILANEWGYAMDIYSFK